METNLITTLEIGWLANSKNNSIVIRTNIDKLLWSAGTWSKSKLKGQFLTNADGISFIVFAPLNEYLATLDSNTLTKLNNLYQDIFVTLNDSVDFDVLELNSFLYGYSLEICKLIDYDSFREWAINKGDLNFEIGEKTSLDETDSADITYFTKDYRELLIFSVYVKLFMPMWGLYYSINRKSLGEEQVLLNVLNIFNNELMLDNIVMIRLYEYIITLSKKRISNIDYVLLTELSTDELIDYCVITALWKKIIIFDARSQVSIIKNLFNVLNGLFKRISASGPSQKYPASESSGVKEQPAKGETYKQIIRLPPAVPALITFEINRPEFIHQINPRINLQHVEQIYNYIDELEIRQSHMTICAAVCKKVLHIRDIQYIDYITIKRLIAISTCCLLDWGLPSIADFISVIPKEKNLSILMSAGYNIDLVEPWLLEDASKKYSLIGSPDSLIVVKDSLIKELICHEWVFKFGKVEDFANEIFKLMLRD